GGVFLPKAAGGGGFKTPSGKTVFSVHPLSGKKLEPGQDLIMTIRRHDQFNNSVYSKHDRYRGISDTRQVVFVNSNEKQAEGERVSGIARAPVGRPHQSFQRRRTNCTAVCRCALRYSERLRRDLLSGGKCFGAGGKRR